MEAAVIDSKDRGGETKAAVGEVSCAGEKGWRHSANPESEQEVDDYKTIPTDYLKVRAPLWAPVDPGHWTTDPVFLP